MIDVEERIQALARMWVYLMDELNDMDEVYCEDPDNEEEAKSLNEGMDALEDVIGILAGADVNVYETWRTGKTVLAEK